MHTFMALVLGVRVLDLHKLYALATPLFSV